VDPEANVAPFASNPHACKTVPAGEMPVATEVAEVPIPMGGTAPQGANDLEPVPAEQETRAEATQPLAPLAPNTPNTPMASPQMPPPSRFGSGVAAVTTQMTGYAIPLPNMPIDEASAWRMRAQAAEQEVSYLRYHYQMAQGQLQQFQNALTEAQSAVAQAQARLAETEARAERAIADAAEVEELRAEMDKANAKAASAEQLALRLSKSRAEVQAKLRVLESKVNAA